MKSLVINFHIKITDKTSKVSYCLKPNFGSGNYYSYSLYYCSEATYEIKNGKEIFNCNKCIEDGELYFNEEENINYCSIPSTRCSIKYCKECNEDTNNVCQECYQDYEVNIVTGSCIKKTEKVPSITWKDIYNQRNSCTKKIKNEYYKGLCFELKGITSSKISYGHAFFVTINFEKKRRIRDLNL